MVVSSAAPLTQDATRTRRVYAGLRVGDLEASHFSAGSSANGLGEHLPYLPFAQHTERQDAFSFGGGDLRWVGRGGRAGTGGGGVRLCRVLAGVAYLWAGADCAAAAG